MDLWKKILEFNDKYFPGWKKAQYIYYSNAIAGEAGELCNTVKKMVGGGTKVAHLTEDDLIEEMADIYIYMVIFLSRMGVNGGEFIKAINEKIIKNINRMEKRED